MFYSYELLCRQHGGRFATIWLLATNRRVSDTSIMKVNISKTAQEIINVVINHYPEHLPKSAQKRFSLYLSSMLMYGCLKAFKRKAIIVLREAIHVSSIKKPVPIDVENPKKRHLVKQSQPLPQAEAASKEAGEQNILQQLELVPVPPLLPTEGTFLERDSLNKDENQQPADASVQALPVPLQDAHSTTMTTNGRSVNSMKCSEINERIIISNISEVHDTQIHPVEPAAIEVLAECLESVKALQKEKVSLPAETSITAEPAPAEVQNQAERPQTAVVDTNKTKPTQHKQSAPQPGSISLEPIDNLPLQKQRQRKKPILDKETKINSKIISKNVETIGIGLRARSAIEDRINIFEVKYPKGPQMLLTEGYKKLNDTLHKLFTRHAVVHQRDSEKDTEINKGISFSSDISLRCEETLSFRLEDRSLEAMLNINQSPLEAANIARMAPEVPLETIAEERITQMPPVDDTHIEKGLPSGIDLPIPPAEISSIAPIPAPSIDSIVPADSIPLHEQTVRTEPLNENEVKDRLKQLWKTKIVVDFAMLCPPEHTSRLVAAKTLDLLLIMHVSRSLRLDQRIRKTPPHFPTGPIYILKC